MADTVPNVPMKKSMLLDYAAGILNAAAQEGARLGVDPYEFAIRTTAMAEGMAVQLYVGDPPDADKFKEAQDLVEESVRTGCGATLIPEGKST